MSDVESMLGFQQVDCRVIIGTRLSLFELCRLRLVPRWVKEESVRAP